MAAHAGQLGMEATAKDMGQVLGKMQRVGDSVKHIRLFMLQPVELQARIEHPHRRRGGYHGKMLLPPVLLVKPAEEVGRVLFEVIINRGSRPAIFAKMNQRGPIPRKIECFDLKILITAGLLQLTLHPLFQVHPVFARISIVILDQFQLGLLFENHPVIQVE